MASLVACARCRHASPPDARFCGACGAALEARCAACEATNPPGNRFCHRCGAALGSIEPQFAAPQSYTPASADKISARGSVRWRAGHVLFGDVSGFTSITDARSGEVHRDEPASSVLTKPSLLGRQSVLGDGIWPLGARSRTDTTRCGLPAELCIVPRWPPSATTSAPAERSFGFVKASTPSGRVGSIGTLSHGLNGRRTRQRRRATAPGRSAGASRLRTRTADREALQPTLSAAQGADGPVPPWRSSPPGRLEPDRREAAAAHPTPGASAMRLLLDAFERRGPPRPVVFVVGEPGVGKSRLTTVPPPARRRGSLVQAPPSRSRRQGFHPCSTCCVAGRRGRA